jgi:hypothetical protein
MHALAVLPLLLLSWLPPSDPAGVYAVLDKVVLLPDAKAPTSIELHGAFALAEGVRGEFYRCPRVGVLRFALGKDAEASRAQWRDLEKLAGTNRVVSFLSRYEMLAANAPAVQVLAADAAPAAPPPYSTGWAVRPCENVDYGPARELALLPRCLPVDFGNEKAHEHWPARSVVFQCTNCTSSGGELRYVFTVETSDGERFASDAVAPGKGITSWAAPMALQVGERITWSVHVVGAPAARVPVASEVVVVPAAAVQRGG